MFLVFKTAAKPSNLELNFGFVPGRTWKIIIPYEDVPNTQFNGQQ